MNIVEDIRRPDVNGVPPKMSALRDRAREIISGPPVLSITASDNLMSCVIVGGSFDPRETWTNGIRENSRYFGFMVSPAQGKRYYQEGENVTVELTRLGHSLATKFRKYTGAPEKCLQKIADWIQKGLI